MHFVGVLGAGMLPLAKLCVSLGYVVSGSDARAGGFETDSGFTVTLHRHGLLCNVDLLVVSFAIPSDAPEVLDATEMGIPIITRAGLLGWLMQRYQRRIGISGSHGKSTTTALIDKLLYMGGVLPTTVSGAKLFDNSELRIGGQSTFVYEACEYRDAFLEFHPTIQLITGIELDHTDYFTDIDSIRLSFAKCANRATEALVINADFDGAKIFLGKVSVPCITYGKSDGADYRYVVDERSRDFYRFSIYRHGDLLLESRTPLIGEYNLSNITAATAVADMLGVERKIIAEAISDFRGIERRMSRIGRLFESEIFYDYAHHPTEILSVIEALRERYSSCTIVFSPHTYSRTKAFWKEFIYALSQSDFTILLDIYPAREKPIRGITSKNLALEIGDNAIYADFAGAMDAILECRSEAVILMGAGNMDPLISMIKQDSGFSAEYC